MRYLASRGLLLLLTLLGLLSFFHISWRPVFVLALCLLIVTHVCYSLLVNDSLVSPQVPEFILQFATGIATSLYITFKFVATHSVTLFHIVKLFWRQKVVVNMKKFWNSYQLSSEANEKKIPVPHNETVHDENQRLSKSFGCEDSLGLTSTPLNIHKSTKNGGLGYAPEKCSSLFGETSDILVKDDSRPFSNEHSPWSANNSLRMRPKASGIKTVQTVAGPLLASTRYNIDPKVYCDISSPGLTARLTKYATEANTKVTHQSRYAAGQFPKVNLNASPTPLIKPNSRKSTPVTVRIAQPITSKLTHAQKKALKDISLKRHASRDDVTELTKKQRTEPCYQDELGNLEEMTQKRAREDSPKSEDDTSAEYKNLRPKKRTKTPSYNDIINSLSSSIHVFAGRKRKAEDNSQEFEKHFKSHDRSQSSNPVIDNTSETSTNSLSEVVGKSPVVIEEKKSENIPNKKSPQPAVKLSDKLFMGAQPENNKNLQVLIEEQGSINSKFTMDDKDEIRKEDITLMRETSMKSRLQSMFDAISGKTSNKINPDVVINAEEVGKGSTVATLNSATITTTINTSPITTSAVVPILKSPTDKSITQKHVTFNLNTQNEVSKSNTSFKMTESVKPTTTQAPTVPNLATSTSSGSALTSTLPNFNFGSGSAQSTSTSVTINSTTPSNNKSESLFMSKTPTFSLSTSTSSSSIASKPSTFVTPNTQNITTTSISFGQTKITPSFSFGKTQATTSAENKVNFSTTATTTTTNMVNSPKSAFTFEKTAPSGVNVNLNAVQNTSTSTNTLNFGQTSAPNTSTTSNTIATSNTSTRLNVGQTTTPSTTASLNFGQTTTQNTSAINFGQTKTSSTSATFNLGQNANSSTLKFGTQTTTTSSNSTIGFGQTMTTSAPNLNLSRTGGITSSSTLNFGQTATTSSTTALGFGQMTTTTTTSTPFKFGQTTTTTSASAGLFGNMTPSTTTNATKPMFGTSTTTSSNIFNTPTFVFGSTATTSDGFGQSNAFGTAKTTTTSSFSLTPSFSNSNTATTTTNIFQTINTVTPSTTLQSIFGTTNTATPSTSSNVFGSTTTAPATTTSTSLFGVSADNFKQQTFAFGSSTNAASTFGAPSTTSTSLTTPTFGGVSTTTLSFGTSSTATPTFGAVSTTTPSFGTASTASPIFGAASTTNPTFGAVATTASPSFGGVLTNATPTFGSITNTTASPSFGSNVTTFGSSTGGSSFGSSTPTFGAATTSKTTSSFGMTAVTTAPTFGASTTTAATPAFGLTATPSFGTQSNQTSTFGSIATPNLNFGATSNGFGGSTTQSPFGSTTPQSPTFGAAVAAPTSPNFTNSNFSFGSSASQPAQHAAQANFNFSSSNNTGNTSGVFQFGTGASKPGGFTFNAPSNAPNMSFGGTSSFGSTPQQPATNFAAGSPGGNMFSIGTGSTAPRARTVRDRLRRQR